MVLQKLPALAMCYHLVTSNVASLGFPNGLQNLPFSQRTRLVVFCAPSHSHIPWRLRTRHLTARLVFLIGYSVHSSGLKALLALDGLRFDMVSKCLAARFKVRLQYAFPSFLGKVSECSK